jgi:hypothetical protein
MIPEEQRTFPRPPQKKMTVYLIDPDKLVRMADEPSLSQNKPILTILPRATEAVRQDMKTKKERYECSKECERLGPRMLSMIGCACAVSLW